MLSYKLHKDNHENFKYIGYLKDTVINSYMCTHRSMRAQAETKKKMCFLL